jgi:hypothetical protein
MSKTEMTDLLLEIKKKLMLRNFDEDVSSDLQELLSNVHKKPKKRSLSHQPSLESTLSTSGTMSIREKHLEEFKLSVI